MGEEFKEGIEGYLMLMECDFNRFQNRIINQFDINDDDIEDFINHQLLTYSEKMYKVLMDMSLFLKEIKEEK